MASLFPTNQQAKQPAPKNQKEFQGSKIALVSSAYVVNNTYSNFIAPLIPSLIERLSLLKVEASVFLFLYNATSLLQPLIGHWADRVNLRRLALAAPAVTAIFISLLGVAPSYPVALLYCLLGGISAATLMSIMPAIVGSLSGNKLGKGMSIWMVSGELGAVFGPIIITSIVATSSLKNTPWLMLGGISISIVLNLLMKNLPDHTANNQFTNHISRRKLLAVMIPLGLTVATRAPLRSAAEIYLPVFMTEIGAGVWLSGISLSILQGFGILGTLFGGFAKDRFGFKPALLFSILVSGSCMLAFLPASGAARIFWLAIFGAANTIVLPVSMAAVQEYFPDNRSLANGIFMAMLMAIHACTALLSGYLYDQIGGHQTYYASALISFLGIPFVFLLPKAEKTSTIDK